MDNNNEISKVNEGASEMGALQEFIEVLVTNEEVKMKFIDNPDEVLKDYDLSESQKLLLKTLDKEDVEKLSPENVVELFSADSAVYTPDIDEDNIEEVENGEDDLL